MRRSRQCRLVPFYCAVQHKVVKVSDICDGDGQHDTGNNVAQRPRSATRAHVGHEVSANVQTVFWATDRHPAAVGVRRERLRKSGQSVSLVDRGRLGYDDFSEQWFDTEDGPYATFARPKGRTLVAGLPGLTPRTDPVKTQVLPP